MSVNYLRISVTDRCNLRCFYCMPQEGIKLKEHKDIMSYEEIYKVVNIFAEKGIRKVRITGGEPLVRLGIEDLIKKLKSISEIDDISMTTNGVLLDKKAKVLRENGLDRVNISLDTLNKSKYQEITGYDYLQKVLDSIKIAKNINLNPVKINVVLIKGYNDNELDEFLDFMDQYNIILRFIEYMPIGEGKNNDNYLSLGIIEDKIKREYDIKTAQVKGNGPAVYYKLNGYQGRLGFISPFSHDICSNCNRLRLTADGKLRPCLLKDEELDLYSNNKLKNKEKLKSIFLKAIKMKSPHFGYDEIIKNNDESMHSIGG